MGINPTTYWRDILQTVTSSEAGIGFTIGDVDTEPFLNKPLKGQTEQDSR
jgi:hypothetical protein